MIDAFFTALHWLLHFIQPILVPVCFILAWVLVFMTGWSMWSTMHAGVKKAKQMHQIPCADCRFFTGDYRLKCPVHPSKALTEEAIHCADYEALQYSDYLTRR